MAKHDVTVRVSAEGRDQLIRDLRSLGGEGEKMARQIERSGVPASRGLLAVNAAAGEVKQGVAAAASRTGSFGAVLGALGPAGITAAAGIGAVALAAGKAFQIAREGMDFADEIDTATKRLGLGVEALQEYRAALQVAGDAAANFDDGARTLLERMGETVRGTGEGVKIFERLGIKVTDTAGRMKGLDDILPEIADGLASVGSEAERADIANKLFGGQGQNFIALLQQGSDALARQRAEMREMGLVMDEQVVKRYAEASDKSEILTKAIDVQLKSAFVDLAPVIVATLGLFSDFARKINDITDAVTELENKTSDNLAAALDEMVRERAQLLRDLPNLSSPFGRWAAERRLAELDERIPRAQEELRLREAANGPRSSTGTLNLPTTDEAIANAERDAQVLANLARQIETFGDARQQAIDTALGRLSKDATPAQRAEVERLAGVVFDATQNQKELNEALQEETRLRQEGRAVTESVATDEEKLAARKAELKRLLDGSAISLETYSRALKQASEQHDPIARGVHELSGELARLATDNLAAARSFDDLADIADQALTRILAKMLEVAAYKPIEDAASNFFSSLVSGVYHGGGKGTDAAPTRSVPEAAFVGAPRFHGGKNSWLQPGEMTAIIRREEAIFTPRQMNNADALIRSLAGVAASRGDGTVNIRLVAPAGTEVARSRASRNADGDLEVDILLRHLDEGLGGLITRGQSHTGDALERRFALDPARSLQG